MDRGRVPLPRRPVHLTVDTVPASTTDESVHAAGWEHDQFAASQARSVYVRHGPVLLYAEVVGHDVCAVIEHRAAA